MKKKQTNKIVYTDQNHLPVIKFTRDLGVIVTSELLHYITLHSHSTPITIKITVQ